MEKKVIGINAVGYGATNERHPMKYNRGLVGVLEQQLDEDVEHNGKHKEWEEPSGDYCSQRVRRKLLL